MEMTNPTWTYQGRYFNDISDFPEGTYGFIYEVFHKPSGLKYLGKKVLRFERNKRLGKRALEALKEERKKKKKKILDLVPNKKLLTYYECKHLFINDVLETYSHQYINDNILGKFYRKDFNND
jgi:hypothetical protein